MKIKKLQYLFQYEKRNRLIALVWMLVIFIIVQDSIIARNIDPIKLYPESSVFQIVSDNQSVPILYDQNDADVVGISVKALADDIKHITDISPALETSLRADIDAAIIAGTLGKSKQIDTMIKTGKLSVNAIEGKWESFLIQVVDNPLAGIDKALVICGSDPRGTAFGVFELSKRLGVSPWVYWADVIPSKQKNLNVAIDKIIMGPPSVKYRGIFLNDEDWGLQPWAAKTFEPETGDIGPKTYEIIFELLLRLKANTIWPAMHPSTKAFYSIPGNKEIAAKYQIFIGTSHAEPMLRNNVGEWDHNKFGEFNYFTNSDVVRQYWRQRIEELGKEDKFIVTLGMRGIHDSGMQGNFTEEEKVEMLERIIRDQREMLTDVLKKDIMNIPQAFVPYKEVLEIYSHGARIPEDVTLVWPDDNHGYIRRLSNAEESKRHGGAGVYYHISYWGRPHDFLWLESIPVSLIWEEMNKAYRTNAKDIWIVNVGDIKPNEIGMNFFLEMSWNPEQFSPENVTSYYTLFAAEQFGIAYAEEIGEILKDYFQLGFSRKPEHMGWSSVYPDTPIKDPELSLFSNGDEVQQRIDAYSKLEERVKTLHSELPERLKDAFYQLVSYKVLGASNMNKKLLYAFKSRVYARQGRVSANVYAEKSRQAFEKIKEITNDYNQHNNGKWMHMMTYNPRELPVYGMPKVGHFEPTQKTVGGIIPEGISLPVEPGKEASLPAFLSATNRRYFIDVFNSGQEPIKWTAKAKDSWIQLSSTGSETSTEERIWVSIDWSRIKGESSQTSSIEFNVGSLVYHIQVKSKQLKIPGDQLFVEDNGVISMEAEHFKEIQNTNNCEWKLIQGLGRQNDAMGTFPVTANSLEVSDDAPSLTYEFFTSSVGEANLRFYCLPSHPINGDHRLRLAVSIDDGQPMIIDAAPKDVMNEYNHIWQTNVLRSTNIVETEVTIPQTGRHQLKILMIDPGVVLDKIEVVMNKTEKLNSYFGSVETKIK